MKLINNITALFTLLFLTAFMVSGQGIYNPLVPNSIMVPSISNVGATNHGPVLFDNNGNSYVGQVIGVSSTPSGFYTNSIYNPITGSLTLTVDTVSNKISGSVGLREPLIKIQDTLETPLIYFQNDQPTNYFESGQMALFGNFESNSAATNSSGIPYVNTMRINGVPVLASGVPVYGTTQSDLTNGTEVRSLILTGHQYSTNSNHGGYFVFQVRAEKLLETSTAVGGTFANPFALNEFGSVYLGNNADAASSYGTNSAWVWIMGQSISRPGLALQAGTLVGAPIPGAIEFNSADGNYYGSPTNGTATNRFPFMISGTPYDGSALTNLNGASVSSQIPLAALPTPTITNSVLVNIYTNPGTATWTKPTGAQFVTVTVIGGGGGGGSGRASIIGGSDGGGIGGGGGGVSMMSFAASFLPSTVAITNGGGGAGATGASSTANGNPGTSGTNSSFGNYCFGGGGGYGPGGVGTTQSASTGGNGEWAGAPSSIGGVLVGAGGNGSPSTVSQQGFMAASGGGGGNITSGIATGSGGSGGYLSAVIGATVGGTGDTANNSTGGGVGPSLGASAYMPGGGGGGSGSWTSSGTTAVGGAGGLYGGGGGGSGAIDNASTANSGNGGNGGNGCVIVTTYF